MSESSPKEILCCEDLVPHNSAMGDLVKNDTALITVNPLKVFLHHKKRLRICRLPKDSTYADLYAKFRAWTGGNDQSPIASEADEMRRVEQEMVSLVHPPKVETRVEVRLDQRTYHCWFEQPSVTFSDLVVNIGRQAEVIPRQLFRKQLFCCGCGRRVTHEEEEFQAVPAACCRVRSLKLSDRRVRDAGTQTKVQRSLFGGIEPLDSAQMKVANVTVGPSCEKTAVSAFNPCHDVADVPVRVCLPDGLQTWHFVRPKDTTTDLVTAMQRLRSGLVIGDISWGDRWLTSAVDWQRQSLTAAWRLEIGAQLLLHGRPPFLALSAWNPDGDLHSRIMRLRDEQSAGEVLETAKKEFKKLIISEGAVIYREELLRSVGGCQKRSIKCYDPTENNYLDIDIDSGMPVEESASSFLVRRYLSSKSALPASPFYVPTLVIKTEVKLLQVTANRKLRAANPTTMQDARFVAHMEGVLCAGLPRKVFWRLVGGGFVDSLSGNLYSSRMEIPDEGRRSWAICFLCRGGRPPLCRVPRGEVLDIFHRAGLRVTVKDGRLQASEPAQPCDMERWLTSYKIDRFQEKFTASARQMESASL